MVGILNKVKEVNDKLDTGSYLIGRDDGFSAGYDKGYDEGYKAAKNKYLIKKFYDPLNEEEK